MDQELLNKLDSLEKKVDAAYKSSEKMRKYFLWTLIISVALIVLPLIGLALLIPYYMQTLQLPAGLF